MKQINKNKRAGQDHQNFRKNLGGQAPIRRGSEGQVMFLTVVVLGAVVSTVTVIAGLLMSYQIRRSADVAHSARAIMAADAGVECMLYQIFSQGDPTSEATCNAEGDNFINNASFTINSGVEIVPGVPGSFISSGEYLTSARSIEITLNLR